MGEQEKPPVIIWNSEHIRAMRAYLGMTQRQLADELGLRQQTISEWETERYHPRNTSIALLNELAQRSSYASHLAATQPPKKSRRRRRKSTPKTPAPPSTDDSSDEPVTGEDTAPPETLPDGPIE